MSRLLDHRQRRPKPAAGAGLSIGQPRPGPERPCDRLPALRGKPSEAKGFSIGFALGIDLGGTKLALALADPDGRLRSHRRRPTGATSDAPADLARIAVEARTLVSDAGLAWDAVDAIGVAVPGPFEPERGLLLAPPNLPGWNEVPVRDVLEEAFGRAVCVENDANAAALAEWRLGAARGASHAVYLTMSTGIGGGLILDGRLYRGKAGGAGEIGHTVIEWDGERCGCGQRGCFEAYCGGASWTRRLRAETPASSRVAALAGGRECVLPEHVVQAAGEGDAFARAELEGYVRNLARGIANVVFAFAPEVVVLGTIPSHAGEALCLAPLRTQVEALVWPVLARGLRILPSALGEELPYYAGICVARGFAKD